MCVSLWAWLEVVVAHHRVVVAHHRVHDHACCYLQADCLESGISSGLLRSTMSIGTFTCLLTYLLIDWLVDLLIYCTALRASTSAVRRHGGDAQFRQHLLFTLQDDGVAGGRTHRQHVGGRVSVLVEVGK